MSNIGGSSYVGKVKTVPTGKGSSATSNLSNNSGGGMSGGCLSAGLSDGLSSCSKMDDSSVNPGYNFAVDPITGNSVENISENPRKRSVKKNGQSFSIC